MVLRVRGRRAKPQERELAEGDCVIGAGRDADIVIDEPRVSRAHVRVRLVPEGVEVVDLESRNGTMHLGQRLHHAVLAPGSTIEVGGVEVRIDPDDRVLEGPPLEGSGSYRGLIGASAAARRLFATLARLEGSLVNVLLIGESGVGKELIAEAIREGSSLRDAPFVVVNSAALGGEVVRSELFGHRRGAFTGAIESRAGALERADGGTLFLDEVGELPLDVQPMLLRALETGDVQRVGDDQVRRVKVRVIAATHRDLPALVRDGKFREDLYYRLAVVPIRIPPLRDRPEDVPLLANHFASLGGLAELPADVLEQLSKRSWPGNARELRNAVQAYLALGTLADNIEIADDALEAIFARYVDLDRPFQEQKQQMTLLFGRTYFQKLLEACSGNRSEAARRVGMDRSYLGKLLARYGLASRDDET